MMTWCNEGDGFVWIGGPIEDQALDDLQRKRPSGCICGHGSKSV